MYILKLKGKKVAEFKTWAEALDGMYDRATDLASEGYWEQDLSQYIIEEKGA